MLKKLFALTVVLGLMSVTPAVMTAAPPQGGKEKHERNEKHPHIRAAIHELEEAKGELQRADHDFGGHRAEAIEAIDNALKQLRQALQYDKK
ncbi:MAG TPA: hypothetical protein VG649_05365 [Candidatus Angelobacter sp.]|jgi:hypothetical protein|nr:hypothetical protein [Candidatus Angelobacter sp.]